MKESKMHYQTKEDAELWVLLIKGDKLALEIMYRRYFPHLLNYGHTISTNEELIKDCIQDLFVNVFNNSKFRPIDLSNLTYIQPLETISYIRCPR